MAMWERHTQKEKGPSFSSSLLDAIYRSIGETNAAHRRNTATKVEDDIESLRRAIIIEKWIENQCANSSTDSSLFSSSETESPKPKTKSRAQKIKRLKEPISPGAKISSFFNSIFSPRNLRSTTRQCVDDEWASMRKSRSMKDKNASARPTKSKTKSSVRFCDGAVGSHFIKKNIDSFRCYSYHSERDLELDDMSCASSDLFELENIGRLGEELPVYETTTIAAAPI